MSVCESLRHLLRCHLVLARPGTDVLWKKCSSSEKCLPCIDVSQQCRLAPQIQSHIWLNWQVHVVVLEIEPITVDCQCLVFAEILDATEPQGLIPIRLDDLPKAIPELGRKHILRWFSPDVPVSGHFAQPGWHGRVATWIEEVTGVSLDQCSGMLQMSLAPDGALARFTLIDSRMVWFKANRPSEVGEFSVTRVIASIAPEWYPRIIAVNEEWRAWLVEDAGQPLDPDNVHEFECATSALAHLQQRTIEHSDDLIAAGACDLRASYLARQVRPVFEYLAAAMDRQNSARVRRIGHARLQELEQLTCEACLKLQGLAIPDTLVHNDLNPANLLLRGNRCILIDWREAGIGNPCLALEYLLRLVPMAQLQWTQHLRALYRKQWNPSISCADIERAFALAPAVAIFAHLLGRGDWLNRREAANETEDGYRRSLARHLDRAAQEPAFLEALNT